MRNVNNLNKFAVLKASLGIPCSAEVFAKACSTECNEPTKLLEVGGKASVDAVELVLSVFSVEFDKRFELQLTKTKR